MANVKGLQQETMALIDTSKALVDKVLKIVDLSDINPSLSLSFETNPIGFLMQILKQLGVQREELINFLVKIMTYVVPGMEIAVKAILLSNIKNMVSCSSDPMIPSKYRKANKLIADNADNTEDYGIEIDLNSIDYLDKLSISPLEDEGKNRYFGLEGVTDVYKLARAIDFDAFLWFVIHRGQFPKSKVVSGVTELGGERVTPKDANLFNAFTLSFPLSGSTIQLGNTFATKNGSVVSMCIDKTYVKSADGKQNRVSTAQFVPVSDDWNSVNWYSRNMGTSTLSKALTTDIDSKKANRDYDKECAICNIQYIDQAATSSPITGTANRKLRFTILPKPYLTKPDIENGDMPWRFKRWRFDAQGNEDTKGRYTVNQEGDYVRVNSRTGQLIIDENSKSILQKNLIECYPGLTVYEFNYDYLMSLKLFDAKALTAELIASLDNMSIGGSGSFQFSSTSTETTEYIKNIIKNIIESDDSKTNDCYYTFSNSQYDTQLKSTQAKHAYGNSKFSKAYEILNEINNLTDGDGTQLHQKEEILKRAITQATVDVTSSSTESNTHAASWNFTFNLVENIVTVLIKAVLTPKVILLLQVNQKIMGGSWEKFTFADIIKAMQKVIESIASEIKDLIVQELLKFALKQLKPILETMAAAIAKERIEGYSDLLTDILKNCPVIWFKISNSYSNTTLDTVDYADIDATVTEKESTSTKDC